MTRFNSFINKNFYQYLNSHFIGMYFTDELTNRTYMLKKTLVNNFLSIGNKFIDRFTKVQSTQKKYHIHSVDIALVKFAL